MDNSLQYVIPILINILRYYLLAGIPFLIFYVLFPRTFIKNKIQNGNAKRKVFLREIAHSTQTTLVLAAVGLVTLRSPLSEYTKVYYDISEYSIWYIPLSILLALIIHDTYFYWMHRAVHHPWIYRRVHLIHHQSVNPTPWTSYSFHFLEAVLEAMIAPILLLLMPMHPIALILFGLSSFVINVYGHLGYEIAPRWLRNSWMFQLINTSTYHNIHHAQSKGNYGLYFRMWDRLMGTEHPDYIRDYDVIQSRRFGAAPLAAPSLKCAAIPMLILSGLISMSATSSKTIEGIWKDEAAGAIIKIYQEDWLYYGQAIGAEDPIEERQIQEHGSVIFMRDFRKKEDNTYCCGTIYQPKKDRTITATITLLDEYTLKINGKYRVFKDTRKWYRID